MLMQVTLALEIEEEMLDVDLAEALAAVSAFDWLGESRKAREAHELEPGSFSLPGLTFHDDAGRSLEIARFFDRPAFCVTYRYDVLRSKVGLIASNPEERQSQVPQLEDAPMRSVLAAHFGGDHGQVLRELRRLQPEPEVPLG